MQYFSLLTLALQLYVIMRVYLSRLILMSMCISYTDLLGSEPQGNVQ